MRGTDSYRLSLERLLLELGGATRSSEWEYVELDRLEEILAEADPPDDDPVAATYDRILGSWLGRVAGCNLGKPIEEGRHWTAERIERYLRLAESHPLRDYIPVLDPMPAGFELRENWPHTTRGRVHGSDRDDDIDYLILAVHLLDQHGDALETEHVAEAWLAYLPITRTYTAERATYVNLIRGESSETAGAVRNPYREWIGALIRGDASGWTNPGQPTRAAKTAYRDAVLSHRGNGTYTPRCGPPPSSPLRWPRPRSNPSSNAPSGRAGTVAALAEAIRRVLALHSHGAGWSELLAEIQAAYGHSEWVHSVNNAALITAGLLWSEGDFATAVGNTGQGGWDTDSNGATVGSVMGALLGAQKLPDHFIAPLEDRTRSAVFGFDNSRISDLAALTLRLGRPS